MIIHVEVSYFDKFLNAKVFASFSGLTPVEDSSGDKTKRLSITKQGDAHIKITLVE